MLTLSSYAARRMTAYDRTHYQKLFFIIESESGFLPMISRFRFSRPSKHLQLPNLEALKDVAFRERAVKCKDYS
jgi:hypothetical protein